MTAQDTIAQAVKTLAADSLTQRIILFGSHARGDADAGWDIDLLVVEAEVADRGAEMVRLRRLLRPVPAAFDVLVYTPAELERSDGRLAPCSAIGPRRKTRKPSRHGLRWPVLRLGRSAAAPCEGADEEVRQRPV